MKKFSAILLFLLFALTLSAGAATAATLDEIVERGTLRIGMDPGYMPFEMVNKKGNIIGFDVDLAKRIAKAMDVKLEIVSTAFDGMVPSLLTKKFDMIISGMTLTQERNLRINFAEPYIVIGQTILIRKNLAGSIQSYKDLNDPKFKVATRLGTTGEFAAKKYIPKATFLSFEKEQEGVMEVVNGRADAFVYDAPFNAVAFAENGQGKLVFLDEPFTYEPLAIGVRRGDYDLVNWLNNFLHQIKNDGTYDRIYRKWFKSDTWLKELQ